MIRYCSPSRLQMLVGRYAYHVGQQSDNLGPTNGGCALPISYDMLPAALKKFSPFHYRTHAFGKYHQGFYAKKFTPTARGFDTFFGFYDGGESHYTHITPFAIWNEPGIPYVVCMTYPSLPSSLSLSLSLSRSRGKWWPKKMLSCAL